MEIVLGIIAMILAVLLILAVVVQNSKGGGLSGTFGASNLNNIMGARQSAQDIEKVTWWLIGLVFAVSFFANKVA